MSDGRQSTQPRIMHLSTERTARGGERQLHFLHEGLLKEGWRSSIVCRAVGMMGSKSAEVHSVPWNGLFDLFGFLRYWGACRRERPDLLHCHDANAFTLGILLGMYTATPVVYTRRVSFPVRPTPLNRWKYGRTVHLVAISSAVEQEMRRIAPHTPLRHVPSGVSGQPIAQEDKLATRQRLGIDPRALVIGCVGHFTPEKNPELLLDLADHLKQRKQVVVLCVGPMSQALQRRAQGMSNVTTTGLVDNAIDYYAAFDFYVSTSSVEGLGSALLDAVIRDIPAFAVDSGGARDIFRSLPRLSMPGDRYDFFRMVEQAIDDPQNLLETTRRLGTETRRDFSVEAMIAGNISVYNSALSRGNT